MTARERARAEGLQAEAEGLRSELAAALALLEGRAPVTLDGQPAGFLIRLGDARFANPMREEHEIVAHDSCGGRIQAGRSGAWCARCLAEVPAGSQVRLGLVLKEGL